jgi:Family of unknown function (DUF5317)
MFALHLTLVLIVPIMAQGQGESVMWLAALIVMIGAVLNMYVTAINGKMPVKMYPEIAEAVKKRPLEYQPMTEATKLAWACDRIPINIGTMSFRVISVGDVLVFLGCGVLWSYVAVLVLRLIRGH